MNKNNYFFVADGVLRSSILTAILLLIFAVLMTFKDISGNINSVFYLITTMVSIMYGTIFSVKKINKNGWLVGILVAFIYMSILYVVSIIAGNSAAIGVNRIIRLSIALLVGALSGMLGINL